MMWFEAQAFLVFMDGERMNRTGQGSGVRVRESGRVSYSYIKDRGVPVLLSVLCTEYLFSRLLLS